MTGCKIISLIPSPLRRGKGEVLTVAKIREIFASIQGEGPYIGYKQLFVRFCGCNLHCEYCDTEFDIKNAKEYSVEELLKIVNDNSDCHSVSLTGGEPLLNVEFLKEFLQKSTLPVYLETNGTLYKNLEEVIEWVDYVSADIKLPSCTGSKPLWEEHEKFFETASQKFLFAKAVFDSGLKDEEIKMACDLCKKYDIELILQPKMNGDNLSVSSEFMENALNKALTYYKKVRLIPQVHKFINVL